MQSTWKFQHFVLVLLTRYARMARRLRIAGEEDNRELGLRLCQNG